jgi:hypothetical protein
LKKNEIFLSILSFMPHNFQSGAMKAAATKQKMARASEGIDVSWAEEKESNIAAKRHFFFQCAR